MTHRNPHKTAMVARSIFSSGKYQVEKPKVVMECQICHQPAEKLNVTASGLFVCDGCKSRIKETSK